MDGNIISFVGSARWLQYFLLAASIYCIIKAVENFRKMLYVKGVGKIANLELREMVREGEIKPPPYGMFSVVYCIIASMALFAATN